MDNQHIRKTFWRDGYAVLPDFFDAAVMTACNDAIEAHYGLSPADRLTPAFIEQSQTEVIPWGPLDEGVEAFRALDEDTRLNDLTTAVVGEGWQRMICMVMYSKPGSKGQAWHQDCPPERDAFNLNRLVYTHDITAEHGGQTVVMPGSHRMGELPSGSPHEDLEGQVVLTPKRGTLVLLHGQTWHRVLKMSDAAGRSSTNLRVAPSGSPIDVTDVAVYRNMRYRFSTQEVVEERG